MIVDVANQRTLLATILWLPLWPAVDAALPMALEGTAAPDETLEARGGT